MSAPRGLTPAEAEAWDRLAATVTPLAPARRRQAMVTAGLRETPPPDEPSPPEPSPREPSPPFRPRTARLRHSAPVSPPPRSPAGNLDSHWERRMKGGTVMPDFTLDLHGHTLGSAHGRLDAGLAQARAMGARVVLLIAGKPRPVAAADRGERRGAIRAKLLDWLAAGPHASAIAAIRPAHRRHGGEGAVYLILRKGH